MRFGDGAWRLLPDVTPTYLSRVDGLQISDTEIVAHVASVMDEERWSTLAGHMFTVRVTSPTDNVIRVQLLHHKGRVRKGPEFDVLQTARPLDVERRDGEIHVRSGDLLLVISLKPWGLNYVNLKTGESITQSPFKSLALMHKEGHGVFMREQMTLRAGEYVYGLGERFSAFTRNGQCVDMVNSDCGTCSDKGYKDVPFFMTSRGWGVFVNSPARVSFEIGTEQVMRAQFANPGEDLDYYFLLGPSPKELLPRLGELTGRPALPPVWTFGLWLTTSFITNYDEQTVMSFVDGMAERNIPLHVFHFDCFWMKAHHWCNFRWDEDVFPDPPGMLRRLKDKGLHLCVWINSFIGERSHLFDEGLEHGYLLERPNGDVYQRPKWQAGMGYVDFTNPEATRWFQENLRALIKMGVDCFKTDFGEEIPLDVVYHDGSDPELMHQFYTYLYNKAVFELLEQELGKGNACVFARSATATCQQFPVHWGGDCYGTFESMAESLRGGLSLALSGFGFWSHDIGGFESKASAAVYKRWVAFGLLSSHSRLHGNSSYRVPWLYDEEASDVVRHFTNLKCRIMPYLMQAALEAHRTNVPMMRAMLLEYPEDPTSRTLDRQYCLGGNLLVAPVFHESKAEYYLPAGEWTHLLTGELRGGGKWCFDELDFFGVPAWIRENSVIAVGTSATQVDYDFAQEPRLVAGKLDGKTPIDVGGITAGNGDPLARFSLTQSGSRVTVTRTHGSGAFEVHLPWAQAASNVSGGELLASAALREPVTTSGVVVRTTEASVSFEWS